MKKLFFFLLSLPLSLFGEFTPELEVQDEVLVLKQLVEASKKNLQDEEALLREMVDFKKKRKAFIEDPTSSKLATALVLSATKVNERIEKSHLSHLFSATFLEEIRFYKSVGATK